MFGKPVAIQLGGQTRNLKYNFNALVTLEETLNINIQDLMKMFAGGARLKDLRALLWAGLVHEDAGLTQEAVGDMIEGVEDFAVIGKAIREAIEASFPAPDKATKAKPTPKIPKN